MEKSGLPYTRGADDGRLLPLGKSEIDSLENLHAFCPISVRLE
jgi:hypothetical protein